uniref:Alpha-soluble NSF attachment protein-like n=1 Tax=Phallusia mammillata TaxID=59560 RepID=A0A6F9DM43_9ASCI|nr:alpha-soluble NSF attachment protein-like [Phallusia mammillata]
MDPKEKEAMDMIADADKMVKSGRGFLSTLFGGSTKLEDACGKYIRAANLLKMTKKWSAAGGAFCKSADLQVTLQNKHEAATNLVDAAGCYKKSEAQQAIKCFSRAIDIFTDMGRFTIAAKHHMNIAELYESEAVDIDKAISHYEKAADYYDGEDSKSSANKCWLKVASYAAQLEQYTKAIELFERVAMASLESPLLKYSVKEYMFKATLCQFCLGSSGVDARQALEKYQEWMPAFEDSREFKLVNKLIEAHENNSADSFAEVIADYDKITRIDEWLTTILLRIKKSISGCSDEIDVT